MGSRRRLTRIVGVPPGTVIPNGRRRNLDLARLVRVREERDVELVGSGLVGIEVDLGEPAVLQLDRIQRRQPAETALPSRIGAGLIVVSWRCTSVELVAFSMIAATSQMPRD